MTTKKDELINQLLDKIEELINGQQQRIDAYEQHESDLYDHEEDGL